MAHNLSILQWNICSYKSKNSFLQSIVRARSIDVVMLQETLTMGSVCFSGYHAFTTPNLDGARGLMTLVKEAIPCSLIANPPHCGDGVESLAVEIQLPGGSIKIYNIYSKPLCESLDLNQVCATAAQDRVIIGGDFNAHMAMLNPRKRPNAAGIHIAEVLETFPEIALLNTKEPTHVKGGVLDLTFATATMVERIRWCVDDTVTSDHYGIVTTLMDAGPAQRPHHIPKWKTDKANWFAFQEGLARCLKDNEPNNNNENVDVLEARLIQAINQAASQTIPKTRPWSRTHKDAWYYNDEIKEVNHRVNMCRKNFRRQRSPDNLALLREAVVDAKETANRVRQEKWLEWCQSFGHQTSLTELWKRVRQATSRQAPKCTHHDPQSEANRLVLEFSARTSTNNLPPMMREKQQNLNPERLALIRDKALEADEADALFSLRELRKSYKSSSGSAPGSDGISHPIISHLGLAGELAFLQVINKSWQTATVPQSWKQATIVPIPKPKEPGKYRPISLLSCLGKTAEKMVLNRLRWKTGPPHEHLHGFTRGKSTAHSISTLLSTICTSPAVVVFLDLEKAFELASPLAIQETLIHKGVKGRLLAWIADYFKNRSANVRFQGHLSQHMPLENGTPQGGVLSPALFNTLMSNILDIHLPEGCKIISYADDLAIIASGNHCLTRAQRCLNLVSEECCRTGLKISAAKSKAMALRTNVRNKKLTIQGMDLEWVKDYLYLGVWIGHTLTFKKEIQYLLDRTKERLSVMKVMTGRHIGAGHKVLRSFYVHAVRPIIDYASVALIASSTTLKEKLETIQNEAARIILGAPKWTKVINLLMEADLPSMDTRIDLMATQFLSKVLQAPRNSYLRQRVLRRLQDYQLFADKSWLTHTDRVLILFQLKESMLAKGMDSPHGCDHGSPDTRVPKGGTSHSHRFKSNY